MELKAAGSCTGQQAAQRGTAQHGQQSHALSDVAVSGLAEANGAAA
jgi:hypothetical protein